MKVELIEDSFKWPTEAKTELQFFTRERIDSLVFLERVKEILKDKNNLTPNQTTSLILRKHKYEDKIKNLDILIQEVINKELKEKYHSYKQKPKPLIENLVWC
jgi:hypothetical protein